MIKWFKSFIRYETYRIAHKILWLLLLFIIASIIVYASPGTIQVKATTFDYTINTSRDSIFDNYYMYYYNDNWNSIVSNEVIRSGRKYFYIPSEYTGNYIATQFFTFGLDFNPDSFTNSTTDIYYFKGILHAKNYFPLVSNFSFINALGIGIEDMNLVSDYYDIYVSTPLLEGKYYSNIVDFDRYVTFENETDENDHIVHELILFEGTMSRPPYYDRLKISFDFGYPKIVLQDFSNVYGRIPATDKRSYLELNQFVFSDEPIEMTLDDFISDEDYPKYDYDDYFEYEQQQESNKDNLIQKIIDEIAKSPVWLKIKSLFKNLFVPDVEYLQNKFNILRSTADIKFSIFIKPVEIFIDILNRFSDLENNTNFVINIPEFTIPGFDVPIIYATSYDLNEVLNNDIINNIWILYLDFIDVFLIIAFLNLSWNKLTSFIGGTFGENNYYIESEVDTYDRTNGKLISSRYNNTRERIFRRRS